MKLKRSWYRALDPIHCRMVTYHFSFRFGRCFMTNVTHAVGRFSFAGCIDPINSSLLSSVALVSWVEVSGVLVVVSLPVVVLWVVGVVVVVGLLLEVVFAAVVVVDLGTFVVVLLVMIVKLLGDVELVVAKAFVVSTVSGVSSSSLCSTNLLGSTFVGRFKMTLSIKESK